MATPMSMSGLPALMDPTNDALTRSEQKKFDSDETRSTDGKAAEIEGAANTNPAGDAPNQTGPKPPDYEPDRFRENLQKGIPIECGKRSVFGFGLSGNQEDALYQYISNKSSKRPSGDEPDRAVLADCWGSPEPERDSNHSDSDDVPVVFSADLSQTLPVLDPTPASSSGAHPPPACGCNDTLTHNLFALLTFPMFVTEMRLFLNACNYIYHFVHLDDFSSGFQCVNETHSV